MELEKLSLGVMGTNCYIIWDCDTLEAAVIDPGFEDERIFDCIESNNLKVKYILLTHGHFDHLGGVDRVKERTHGKILIHENDGDCLPKPERNLSVLAGLELKVTPADGFLFDGETLKLGSREIKVIHTPGHSAGGVCFLVEDQLISGDTLFYSSIGRTDFADGDLKEIIKSIRDKIIVLGDEIQVYPGHGENTTIGYERLNNPFLKGNL
ncbi:MAG: MBL fold metallo-hydrolase [Eubacteriaceae bacterium]